MPRTTPALLGLGALLVAAAPQRALADVVALEQLTQLAVRNRPALAAGDARTRAARAELEQARSGYYPRLALSAGTVLAPGSQLYPLYHTGPSVSGDVLVQGAKDSLGDPSAYAPSVRNELDLELKGSVYDFGRTRAAEDAGRAGYAAAQAAEDAARDALVQAVRAAYLGWLGQHALTAIGEEAAADAARRSARVQALIDEGARPKAELSIARADEMLTLLELERSRGQERAAKLALEQAVGSPLPADAEPNRALLEAEAAPAASAAADADAGAGDAALRALSLQRDAASAEARRLEHADAPLLAGVLSAGMHTQGVNDFHAFPSYALGLSFSVPLLDGGASTAAADAAHAKAQALAAELEDARGHQQDARARARLDHDNALAQQRTAQALLEVVTQRLHDAEESYELGAGGLDAVATARTLLAQTELLHAKLAGAEAKLRLEAP